MHLVDKQKPLIRCDELLIDAVRAYPHIYNQQDRNFKDNTMKRNSWKEIASTVNSTDVECIKRWRILRERFGKEKRQREIESKSGSLSGRTTSTLYESMLFLNDHIKSRKSSWTNVPPTKLHDSTPSEKGAVSAGFRSGKGAENNMAQRRAQRRLLPARPPCEVLLDHADSPIQSTPRNSTNSDDSKLEHSMIALCQCITQTIQNDKLEQNDEAFAKLIVHQLKTYPVNEKLRRQRAMMTILFEPLNND